MHFCKTKSGGMEMSGIHPFFAELLAALPNTAARHEGAVGRLYPAPLDSEAGEALPELLEDWREHVQPGLGQFFASSREIVAADLVGVDGRGAKDRVVIPREHVDAWLNTLNQARLILAEENHFGERDLSRAEQPDLSTRRGLSLFKVHLYAQLQEMLIGVLD